MKLKLSNKQIKEMLEVESIEFPKYTSQIMNLANQNSQGTRPKVVGQLSVLIQKFKGKELHEWEEWYLKQHPDAIGNATKRVLEMIENFQKVMTKIDKKLIEAWVKDLVIVKTFIGLRFQKAILKAIAEKENKEYRLANPQDESKGIDGFIGNEAVSIKPISYEIKKALPEHIKVRMVYYKKVKDGVTIEY